MTIKGSGRRVLRFAVTGALLGGASCDSGKETTTSPEDSKKQAVDSKDAKAKEGKTGEPVVSANPGPEPEPKPKPEIEPDIDEERTNTNRVEEPVPIELVEPDNVNTQKIEEPPPEPELREPKYVNTRQVEEPKVLEEPAPREKPAAKEKPVTRTNTGRVPDPLSPKSP